MSPIVLAKPEYGAAESKNCPFCHTRQGPPQLNDAGAYYASHNHSLEGYVPKPPSTPTPVPTELKEIGVHMNTWDVGITVVTMLLSILLLAYIVRL